jgi:hypothetical protein
VDSKRPNSSLGSKLPHSKTCATSWRAFEVMY